MTFLDTGLSKKVVEGLAVESITTPLPIQEVAIPAILENKDFYLSAPTGTGKTLAYLLPLFEKMDSEKPALQTIVLAPTHELASQIHQQALRLSENSKINIRSLLLVGGANTKRQIEKLKKKPQLVVGSVGRVLELIRMKKLKISHLQAVVVDEADRMLDGKSQHDLDQFYRLFSTMPQLIFVSATQTDQILKTIKKWAPDLEQISVGTNQINSNIQHIYFVVEEREKANLLRKIVRSINPQRALVFLHRNKAAALVRSKMQHYNISVGDLHGTHGKEARKKAIDQFRKGTLQLLIASDVAARGLDIKGVDCIFNYDVPANSQAYLHRAGRTGRAKESGIAISLVTPAEIRLIQRHEKALKIEMIEALIQDGILYSATPEEEE